MNRMKWMLPVLVGIVLLGLFWWFTRSRTYTAQDLVNRDNTALLLILADLDEKELVRLRQELVELRRQNADPAQAPVIDRVLILTTNAMRQRGIDERKLTR